MTANRNAPTEVTDPGGMAGDTYAGRIAEEIAALYVGRINKVSSIGGSANAITGVCTPPLAAAYQVGETFRFTPTANNSSTVTVNWDSRGAVALRDPDAVALAADDLVNGRSTDCWYDGSVMRLGHPTERALLAALTAEIAAASSWEVLGDTTVSSPVANVEHIFTAGDYTLVVLALQGLSPATNNVSLSLTLRDASGAIVTLTHGGGTISNAGIGTGEVRWYLDLSGAATKRYAGEYFVNATGTPDVAGNATATSANTADRVRVAYSSGNIDAGRITTYGRRKPS